MIALEKFEAQACLTQLSSYGETAISLLKRHALSLGQRVLLKELDFVALEYAPAGKEIPKRTMQTICKLWIATHERRYKALSARDEQKF